MSEPLPFVAFASPDGGSWGLALGDHVVLGPQAAPSSAAEIERISPQPGAGLLPARVGASPALTGTVPHPAGADSLRVAVALFGDGRAFALSALRPRRARGHDRDEIVATVVEGGEPRPVEDPRLSVTLDAGGSPTRVGLELWLAVADEDHYEFPRRAAGQVVGEPVELVLDDVRAVAHLVRWRSRGEDGAGWFVLARSR